MFFVFVIYIMCFLCSNKLYFYMIIYIYIYIYILAFSQNLSNTLLPASAVISSRVSLSLYHYGEDLSVKQHQYHIVWNHQRLYFEIYDFFISVVYKIYVCTNKEKYISLPHRSFSHFRIGYFDWRSISLLHILEQ